MAAAAAAACAALASLLLSRIAGATQCADVIDGCYIEAGDHSPDLNVRASQGAADELFRPGEQAAQSRRSPQNEAERQTTGDIRVSGWAIAFAIIIGVIVVGVVWAWLKR